MSILESWEHTRQQARQHVSFDRHRVLLPSVINHEGKELTKIYSSEHVVILSETNSPHYHVYAIAMNGRPQETLGELLGTTTEVGEAERIATGHEQSITSP
jgi:hypothetical protein